MSESRNFDEFYNGNREFTIGGQTFHWRPIHWRAWGELIDRRVAEEAKEAATRKAKIDKLVKAGKTQVEAEDIVEAEETVVENYEQLVERIVVYLEPNEVEGFKIVVEDRGKNISIAQLSEIMVWLQEVQTPDRPTVTPVTSSPSPGPTGATSPAA